MDTQRQSQNAPSFEKLTRASRSSTAQYEAQGATFKDNTQLMKKSDKRKVSPYWRLPLEIRMKILEFLMPEHICCVRSVERVSSFPSTSLPEFSSTFIEWEEELIRRSHELTFVIGDKIVHTEWWNKWDNQIYFPGIRAMDRWARWEEKLQDGTTKLQGATVIANVLELIEDQYRGPRSSNVFAKHIKLGTFDGVKKFQLVLLTVECGEGLDIYGDDARAVVDLDDKRLPSLLKPFFTYMRRTKGCPHWAIRHRNSSNLVRHLRSEWNKDLKQLFEEQWLQNQTATWSTDMFTDEHFGYKNRHIRVNREHRTVEKLLRRMPVIQPVIMFEKRWPDDCDTTMKFGNRQIYPSRRDDEDKIWFGGEKGNDGLMSISNRRGSREDGERMDGWSGLTDC